MEAFHFRLLFASLFLIILLAWGWRWTKGTAGSHKNWMVWLIIIGLIFVFCPMVGTLVDWANQPSGSVAPRSGSVGVTARSAVAPVSQVKKYDYYFKLDDGKFLHGQNESKPHERTAEWVETGDPNLLYFDLPYFQCGQPERTRFRLRKVRKGLFEGTAEQENPPSRSRITLNQLAVGVYAGKQTWQDGSTAICHFKRM